MLALSLFPSFPFLSRHCCSPAQLVRGFAYLQRPSGQTVVTGVRSFPPPGTCPYFYRGYVGFSIPTFFQLLYARQFSKNVICPRNIHAMWIYKPRGRTCTPQNSGRRLDHAMLQLYHSRYDKNSETCTNQKTGNGGAGEKEKTNKYRTFIRAFSSASARLASNSAASFSLRLRSPSRRASKRLDRSCDTPQQQGQRSTKVNSGLKPQPLQVEKKRVG